eukprot:Mrub_07295.p1 GENE.Mrub_07295~~Mrub_07295.p1  ORF type:complete len:304 (+),score=87.80 Mrub_07295:81-914(+)
MINEVKSKMAGTSLDLTNLKEGQDLPYFHEFKKIIDNDSNIPNIIKQAKNSTYLNLKVKFKGKYDYDNEILIGPVQMNNKIELIDDTFFYMVYTPLKIFGENNLNTKKTILVERGWLPASLKAVKDKLNEKAEIVELEGVLRPSHWNPMASNNSLLQEWTSLKLNEVGLACHVDNIREFECFYLKQLQFEDTQLHYRLAEAGEGDYLIAEGEVLGEGEGVKEGDDTLQVLRYNIPIRDSVHTLTLTNVSPERHFVYFLQMMIIGYIGFTAFKRKIKL